MTQFKDLKIGKTYIEADLPSISLSKIKITKKTNSGYRYEEKRNGEVIQGAYSMYSGSISPTKELALFTTKKDAKTYLKKQFTDALNAL